MCVCVSRSEPDALWPNPSSHSFRSWLIWKVNSSSLRRCKKFRRVMWPWPIYLAPKWPPTKIAFFSLCLVDLWENGRRYRNDFNGQLLGKWVWAFQRHQNQPPNLTPSPHLGGRKHEKNAKNGFYHFQMIKLCCEVFPIKNFQRQSCLHICLEDISKKLSKSVHNYTFYTDFSAPPRLTQMR